MLIIADRECVHQERRERIDSLPWNRQVILEGGDVSKIKNGKNALLCLNPEHPMAHPIIFIVDESISAILQGWRLETTSIIGRNLCCIYFSFSLYSRPSQKLFVSPSKNINQ
jgi:hypothetical protein